MRPVQPGGRAQLDDLDLVQSLPRAGLVPVPQPPPACDARAGVEALLQVLSLDPCVQQIQAPTERPGRATACSRDTGSCAHAATAAAQGDPAVQRTRSAAMRPQDRSTRTDPPHCVSRCLRSPDVLTLCKSFSNPLYSQVGLPHSKSRCSYRRRPASRRVFC